MPNGVVRVDRTRLAFEYELTLGHFGLPHIDGVAASVTVVEASARRHVVTATIADRSVALITYYGWDGIEQRVHRGHNAEAAESTVVFGRCRRVDAKSPAMQVLVCAMLHKRVPAGSTLAPWTPAELDVVTQLDVDDVSDSGSPLGVRLTLADGTKRVVDFGEIDGYRMC